MPLPWPLPEMGRGTGGEAAEEAGDVGGGGVDVDRAEIDEAGDFVAGEEDMIVPDVAETGLERQRHVGERLQLRDGSWDGPRQRGNEFAGERDEIGPCRVGDCAGQGVDSAVREVVQACEAAGDSGRRTGDPWRWGYFRQYEIDHRKVELRESGHRGAEFINAWRVFVIGRTEHPRFQFPQVTSVCCERFAIACRNWSREERDAALCGMVHNGVNEMQMVGRGMLGRPAAKYEGTAGRGNTPELRTAHATGGTKKFDKRGAAIARISLQ